MRSDSPHDRGPIGHELVDLVDEIGAEVREVDIGDRAVAPMGYSDGTCAIAKQV